MGSVTEKVKDKTTNFAQRIQQNNIWVNRATQQEIIDFLNEPENLCTPGFILRRQLQKNFSGLMAKIPGAEDCADLTNSGNVAWTDTFVASLSSELESEIFDGYGDAKLGIKKEQWHKYLNDEAFCNRETAIKLIFALNMDGETAAKFLLSNNYSLLSVRNPFEYICIFCLSGGFSYKIAQKILTEFEEKVNALPITSDKKPKPIPNMTVPIKNKLAAILNSKKTFDTKKSDLVSYMIKNLREFTVKVKRPNNSSETKYADGFSLQNIAMLKLLLKYLVILYPHHYIIFDQIKLLDGEIPVDANGIPKVYRHLTKAMVDSQDIHLIGFDTLLVLNPKSALKRAYDRIPFNDSVVLPMKNLSQTLRSIFRAVERPTNSQDIDRSTIMLLTYFFITGYLYSDVQNFKNFTDQFTADTANVAQNKNTSKLVFAIAGIKDTLDKISFSENPLQDYINIINVFLKSFGFSECYLPFVLDRFILLCLITDPTAVQANALTYLAHLVIHENYIQIAQGNIKPN